MNNGAEYFQASLWMLVAMAALVAPLPLNTTVERTSFWRQASRRWHPGKEDAYCKHYGDCYSSGASKENSRQLSAEDGKFHPLPAHQRPEASNAKPGIDEPTLQEIALSTILVNISVAVPKAFSRTGVPNLLTTAVKDYLRETNVTTSFFQLEYDDGRHFALDVWQLADVSNPNRSLAADQPFDYNLSSYPNASVLGLVALRDDSGYLIEDIAYTKYSWVHHTVYLVAYEEAQPPEPQTRTHSIINATDPTPILVQDGDLIEWLRIHLQHIVYQDIRLQGPCGPYYDTNNRNQNDNRPNRNISFLEWALQEYGGISIGSVAIPGEEENCCWDTLIIPSPETSAAVDIASSERESAPIHPPQQVYSEPLEASSMDLREWLGVACLVGTVVFTTVLSIISNEVAKRRAQEEMWGNLQALEYAEEEMDYLNVGWRFATTDNNAVDDNNDENPTTTMEVFDKREFE